MRNRASCFLVNNGCRIEPDVDCIISITGSCGSISMSLTEYLSRYLLSQKGNWIFFPPPVRLLPKLFPFFHFPVTCCCFSGNENAKVLIESKPSGNHLRMREATHAFLKFWNFLVIGGQGLIIDLPIICNQNESSWPIVFWYLFDPFSINLFLMILNSR